MIKKQMFRPYYIENWTFILDTAEMGISDLPIDVIKKIIGSMSTNFCATLNKMFILNPGFGLRNLWKIVKPFIDEET